MHYVERLARGVARSLRSRRPRALSTEDFIRLHSAEWHPAIAAEDVQRVAPLQFGTRPADWSPNLDNRFPALGVYRLPRGLLLGSQGWAFTADGSFLPQASWFGRDTRNVRVSRSGPKPRHLKGVCLSLASDFAVGNYGHFLLDCLGRYGLFLKAGFHPDDVDHIFCPKPLPGTSVKIMQDLGIPLEKCIWSNDEKAVSADVVLVPTFPGTRRNYQRWLVEFLRSPYPAAAAKPERLIYIPREGTRKIANQPAVESIARGLGFEIFDFSRCTDEPRYFAEARVVVGAHGAGLTNIAFCQDGSTLLELVPSDHVYPYYYTLADSARMRFGYLVGESLGQSPKDRFGPSPFDFTVDEDELTSALTAIVSS